MVSNASSDNNNVSAFIDDQDSHRNMINHNYFYSSSNMAHRSPQEMEGLQRKNDQQHFVGNVQEDEKKYINNGSIMISALYYNCY